MCCYAWESSGRHLGEGPPSLGEAYQLRVCPHTSGGCGSGLPTCFLCRTRGQTQDTVLLLSLALLFSGALGATLISISFVFHSPVYISSLHPLHFPSPSSYSHLQLASPPYPPFPSDYLALQLPEPSPLRPKLEKRPRLPRKLKVPCCGDYREGPQGRTSS